MGVLPNYRTADASQEGSILSVHQKLSIARKDTFDYPLIMVSGLFAGVSQASGQHPSFGGGAQGYARRFATNYGDQAMGNMFTEGFFPAALHQDPRYFRRGHGTFGFRLGYALSRVILTRNDTGSVGFNYSEWLGNASAVAISNAYYPDTRNLRANSTKLVTQVSTDALSQVLKEFWPDIRRRMTRKKGKD